MARTSLARALDPIEFRFTDPDDIQKYGFRWYTYDEASVLRLPARALLALEVELGEPLPGVLNGFRRNSVMGDLAVTWIAVRAHDEKLAGSFDEFDPVTMAVEWRKPGKEEQLPMMPEPDSSSEPTISATPDTVVLSSLPIAELPTS